MFLSFPLVFQKIQKWGSIPPRFYCGWLEICLNRLKMWILPKFSPVASWFLPLPAILVLKLGIINGGGVDPWGWYPMRACSLCQLRDLVLAAFCGRSELGVCFVAACCGGWLLATFRGWPGSRLGGWVVPRPIGVIPYICAAGPFHLKKLKMDKIQIIFSNFLSILPFWELFEWYNSKRTAI